MAKDGLVVLVQPPFFRAAGSHNDRSPLELAYASRFLKDAEIDHVVVNADFLGSTMHVPWRRLFENTPLFCDAVDGKSPLLDETVELILQYRPSTVVLAAGDSCIPTKDFGSPYIAARLSQMLRAYGVRTIGIGPMFLKGGEAFRDWFDDLFVGMVNRSLVDLVSHERPDVMTGSPQNTLPCFDYTVPAGSTDYVATSFGCNYGCSFCMAPLVSGGAFVFQPVPLVLEDLFSRAKRLGTKRLYLSDMIFPLNIRRMRLMADALEGSGFLFSCESRTNTLKPEMLELMRRIGIKTVKVGLESTDDETLAAMNKQQTLVREEDALKMLREYGMNIVGYLILGDFYPSIDAMDRALDRAAAMDVDHFVVNIAAYGSFSWEDERRYDSHFSMRNAARQGVPERIVMKALALQEGRQNPTVDLLPPAPKTLA